MCCLLFLAASVLGLTQTYSQLYDIVYSSGAGAPQKLDLYLPPVTANPKPGIVFVHGGGWTAGDKSDFASWGQYYASLGYVCISINYRLAPAYTWPAQIDDAQSSVRWMRKNAGALGLDANRIGAVGASAGGHLVLLLGSMNTLNSRERSLNGFSSKVQAVVDFCGPTDFSNPFEWDPSIWALITGMVGSSSPQALAIASPMTYTSIGDAPTLIFHGDADTVVPVAQSRRLASRMQTMGVPVTYYEFQGEGHGFSGDVFEVWLNAMNFFIDARLGH